MQADVIHLLPDSVANQIAAGEVVDRPSSVVKELVENSIDAGATDIRINIKNAGKTLIQVIDNGEGMSETDARFCFERHATSKIKQADDLFTLRTMGFRGEALASIAAVSQVELRTRRQESDLGTQIVIEASIVTEQNPTTCTVGSNFSIKNLFFNIPARRRFLKADVTEFGHILSVFKRIALIYPEISFTLTNDGLEMFQLGKETLAQRIINIFGKKMKSQLLPVDTETSLVKISGYVCRPESASKRSGNQYFFVNGRFMRHAWFHRAVVQAYENMLRHDVSPDYFLCLELDPSNIDVNIHPQKIEIKFDNEKAIWSIIHATVRESLGKFNIIPDMDFDNSHENMPVLTKNQTIKIPSTGADSSYNPFSNNTSRTNSFPSATRNWEQLYEGFVSHKKEAKQTVLPLDDLSEQPENKSTEIANTSNFIQFSGRYILTVLSSKLTLIDQHRAHYRVLYEKYFSVFQNTSIPSQQLMFPSEVELTAEESQILSNFVAEFQSIGFDLNIKEGKCEIKGIPTGIDSIDYNRMIRDILSELREGESMWKEESKIRVAKLLAKQEAIPYGRALTTIEMEHLVGDLFTCKNCNNAPDGNPIIQMISIEDINNQFLS